MIQKNHETEKISVSPKGQGTVFVRPRFGIISIIPMSFFTLFRFKNIAKKLILTTLLGIGLFEGVRYEHWPVWVRPYNENILSRVIWFDGDTA